jgi:5-amino-6-(5-phosphoribosylamino)uracil reductase
MNNSNKRQIFTRIVTELSLDGKTTLGLGKSSRAFFSFQNPDLKQFTHEQRATFDGILVGAETVRIDNPFLNVRGIQTKQPNRIVITRSGNLPNHCNILDGSSPTILVMPENSDKSVVSNLQQYPIKIIFCGNESVDINLMITKLHSLGLKKLLIEGGRSIVEMFLKDDLVDEFMIKHIPIFIGGNNTPHLLNTSADLKNSKNVKWHLSQLKKIGGHAVSLYERKQC